MPSDSELLLSYARDGNQAAFTELVRGHVDLVYSAAARRVGGDPHAAEEITQSVFIALARNAQRLASHPVLNAWLHASTRNAAANLRRSEQRRERQLQEIHAMQEPESSERLLHEWQSLRGVLDEALDELSDADRSAVILRFFENHPYPAIGRILGVQEEAARMRVGRALEKLRTRLARRGVVSTAAMLGSTLSAHSVASGPAGLVATTVAAATAVTAAVPVAGILQFMSMTKLTGTLVALAALVSVGAIAYRSASPRDSTPSAVKTASRSATPPQSESQEPTSPVVKGGPTRVNSAPATASEAENKIAALRDLLALFPEQSIPELKLATDADWHVAVEDKLETPDDFRRAVAKLRIRAENRFANLIQPALVAFLQANNRQFPTDTAQLQPFAGEKIDAEMLRRYRVAPAPEIPNVRMGGDWIITQNALIDLEYDHHSVIGPNGFGSASSLQSPSALAGRVLIPVIKAYRAATGMTPNDVSELLPYATTPEQKNAIEVMKRADEKKGSR